jgi:tetratricopeptide (TPR) repeat protein
MPHLRPQMPLQPSNEKSFQAALGYSELGMYRDADAELNQLDGPSQEATEVLALRVDIYRVLGKPELMQESVAKLQEHDLEEIESAISLVYSNRRGESLEVLKMILLTALDSDPEQPIIHYNLACYECQVGDFKTAARHLARAIQLNATFELLALQDEELRPLWKKFGLDDV